MRNLLPDSVVGAMAGFGLGVLGYVGLAHLGVVADGERFGMIALGVLGAIAGGVIGAVYRRPSGEGGVIARWCVGMAALVGGAGFLAGFVGPILLTPDSPQGPLLGIFITGPLGAIAGAVLGLMIGLARLGRPRAWQGSPADAKTH